MRLYQPDPQSGRVDLRVDTAGEKINPIQTTYSSLPTPYIKQILLI